MSQDALPAFNGMPVAKIFFKSHWNGYGGVAANIYIFQTDVTE